MSDAETPPTPSPQYLTSDEAAAILRCLPDTVRRKAMGGQIPALKVGRGWRFEREQLHAFIRGEWKPPETAHKVELGRPGVEAGAEIFRRERERKQLERRKAAPK